MRLVSRYALAVLALSAFALLSSGALASDRASSAIGLSVRDAPAHLGRHAGRARAASGSSPRVVVFVALPVMLPAAGGAVRLEAVVRNATSCRFSSATSLRPLPVADRCSSGDASVTLHLGRNTSASPLTYSFALSIVGHGKHSSSSVAIRESAAGATKPKPGLVSAPKAAAAPPVITVPGDVRAAATEPSGAPLSYSASATPGTGATLSSFSCSPASGSTFAIGTTTVNCNARDSAGNTASSSFTVTITDLTAPVIGDVPANITASQTSAAGAVVHYASPTATDIVMGSVPVSCLPASGSTFAVGATTVDCSATDSAGNTATATFTVTVQ